MSDAPSLRRILIVGTGLAGLRAAMQLRADGFDGELTLLGAERHPPYDRPPLSKELLAGDRTRAEVGLPGAGELDARWLLGDAAAKLDLHARRIRSASGRELPFDGLVLATGSVPRRLPPLDPGRDCVAEVRTIDDALRLRQRVVPGVRLLIVGAGFIGVEVAATARALGADVTIVSLEAPLAVAGPIVSAVATDLLTAHGVRLLVGRRITASVQAGVELDDGRTVGADVTVVAVGAAPATAWLEGSGLRLGDGILCDASCAALGAERVVVAGDVARWPNRLFGDLSMRIEHWTNAAEQGAWAARTLLAGPEAAEPYAPVPSFWSDHFGVRLQAVGVPAHADRFEIVDGSPAEPRFAAAALRGGALVGAVSYGMPRALLPLRRRLADGEGAAAVGIEAEIRG